MSITPLSKAEAMARKTCQEYEASGKACATRLTVASKVLAVAMQVFFIVAALLPLLTHQYTWMIWVALGTSLVAVVVHGVLHAKAREIEQTHLVAKLFLTQKGDSKIRHPDDVLEPVDERFLSDRIERTKRKDEALSGATPQAVVDRYDLAGSSLPVRVKTALRLAQEEQNGFSGIKEALAEAKQKLLLQRRFGAYEARVTELQWRAVQPTSSFEGRCYGAPRISRRLQYVKAFCESIPDPGTLPDKDEECIKCLINNGLVSNFFFLLSLKQEQRLIAGLDEEQRVALCSRLSEVKQRALFQEGKPLSTVLTFNELQVLAQVLLLDPEQKLIAHFFNEAVLDLLRYQGDEINRALSPEALHAFRILKQDLLKQRDAVEEYYGPLNEFRSSPFRLAHVPNQPTEMEYFLSEHEALEKELLNLSAVEGALSVKQLIILMKKHYPIQLEYLSEKAHQLRKKIREGKMAHPLEKLVVLEDLLEKMEKAKGKTKEVSEGLIACRATLSKLKAALIDLMTKPTKQKFDAVEKELNGLTSTLSLLHAKQAGFGSALQAIGTRFKQLTLSSSTIEFMPLEEELPYFRRYDEGVFKFLNESQWKSPDLEKVKRSREKLLKDVSEYEGFIEDLRLGVSDKTKKVQIEKGLNLLKETLPAQLVRLRLQEDHLLRTHPEVVAATIVYTLEALKNCPGIGSEIVAINQKLQEIRQAAKDFKHFQEQCQALLDERVLPLCRDNRISLADPFAENESRAMYIRISSTKVSLLEGLQKEIDAALLPLCESLGIPLATPPVRAEAVDGLREHLRLTLTKLFLLQSAVREDLHPLCEKVGYTVLKPSQWNDETSLLAYIKAWKQALSQNSQIQKMQNPFGTLDEKLKKLHALNGAIPDLVTQLDGKITALQELFEKLDKNLHQAQKYRLQGEAAQFFREAQKSEQGDHKKKRVLLAEALELLWQIQKNEREQLLLKATQLIEYVNFTNGSPQRTFLEAARLLQEILKTHPEANKKRLFDAASQLFKDASERELPYEMKEVIALLKQAHAIENSKERDAVLHLSQLLEDRHLEEGNAQEAVGEAIQIFEKLLPLTSEEASKLQKAQLRNALHSFVEAHVTLPPSHSFLISDRRANFLSVHNEMRQVDRVINLAGRPLTKLITSLVLLVIMIVTYVVFNNPWINFGLTCGYIVIGNLYHFVEKRLLALEKRKTILKMEEYFLKNKTSPQLFRGQEVLHTAARLGVDLPPKTMASLLITQGVEFSR